MATGGDGRGAIGARLVGGGGGKAEVIRGFGISRLFSTILKLIAWPGRGLILGLEFSVVNFPNAWAGHGRRFLTNFSKSSVISALAGEAGRIF